MTTPPIIYGIHGSDAPQHLGEMQAMMTRFGEEKRIGNFIPVAAEEAQASITNRVKENDVIILFLTQGLEPKRKSIANLLSQTKSRFARCLILEIIIDNIPFDNEYITLPKSLKPIRQEHDMDLAWSDIEESLKEILPAQKLPAAKRFNRKYIIYAIIVLILLTWFFWPRGHENSPGTIEPTPDPRVDTIKG